MISTFHTNRFAQLSILSTTLFVTSLSLADELETKQLAPSQHDFGGVGLLQMPTGRMAPEGEFNIGGTFNEDYYHGNVSLQLFPWLETTFRYTQVPDTLYSNDPSFSGDTIYTDKGIDVKFRLFEESYWLPETSVGLRDFGGTGLFDSEFIAATKRLGPVDVTVGMGWGYIGNSGNFQDNNKNTSVDCGRNTGYKGNGGNIDYQRWFKGCSAIFAGLEYQTPWDPLRIKVEYDANDYVSDFPVTRGAKVLTQKSNINYGALYSFGEWGDLRLSFERGNTWTVGYSLSTNFNNLKLQHNDLPKKQITQDNTDRKVEYPNIANELASNAGYMHTKFYLKNKTMTIVAVQTKYRDKTEAHERAARVLLSHFPHLTSINIIEKMNNLPLTETRIDTAKFKHAIEYKSVTAKVVNSTILVQPRVPRVEPDYDKYQKWNIGLSPKLYQSFGGSENFYMYSAGLLANSHIWLSDNLGVGASVYLNVFDNYDQFLYTTPPDGTNLKRVRTLVRKYVSDNPLQMNNLQLTWMDKLSDNIHYQAYAGYLETMFGGVGSEVLYRDIGSDWAFGVDINYVKQRDPENMFKFYKNENQFDDDLGRPYRVQTGVATGQASVYYQPSWFDDVLLKVSYGKYLSEDTGVEVNFSKRFDSGVIVGAYAVKTNLSAKEFGEGSFNKGFYISIPFDTLFTVPTKSRGHLNWQPLTRDGGQQLGRRYNLFDITDGKSPWFGAPSKAQ